MYVWPVFWILLGLLLLCPVGNTRLKLQRPAQSKKNLDYHLNGPNRIASFIWQGGNQVDEMRYKERGQLNKDAKLKTDNIVLSTLAPLLVQTGSNRDNNKLRSSNNLTIDKVHTRQIKLPIISELPILSETENEPDKDVERVYHTVIKFETEMKGYQRSKPRGKPTVVNASLQFHLKNFGAASPQFSTTEGMSEESKIVPSSVAIENQTGMSTDHSNYQFSTIATTTEKETTTSFTEARSNLVVIQTPQTLLDIIPNAPNIGSTIVSNTELKEILEPNVNTDLSTPNQGKKICSSSDIDCWQEPAKNVQSYNLDAILFRDISFSENLHPKIINNLNHTVMRVNSPENLFGTWSLLLLKRYHLMDSPELVTLTTEGLKLNNVTTFPLEKDHLQQVNGFRLRAMGEVKDLGDDGTISVTLKRFDRKSSSLEIFHGSATPITQSIIFDRNKSQRAEFESFSLKKILINQLIEIFLVDTGSRTWMTFKERN